MKIKVCGMKSPDNIEAVAAMNPDFMGFIFYEKSPRFINQKFNPALFETLQHIKKVGVFVNAELEEIISKVDEYRLDYLQLHGNESPAFCMEASQIRPVMKAFGVDENFDFQILSDYIDYCQYFLFDTKTPAHGGSGKKFNWEIMKQYPFDKPFFISGGIDLDDIGALSALNELPMIAVDINSKFETEPGLKDVNKVNLFIKSVRQTPGEIKGE